MEDYQDHWGENIRRFFRILFYGAWAVADFTWDCIKWVGGKIWDGIAYLLWRWW